MAKSHKTCMEHAEIIDTFGTYQYVTPSPPPISFLVGGFISEYLVVLGANLLSLDACVEIYLPSFVASLCLGKVS